MTIKKQAFYEGAALYLLARAGAIEGIRYEPPFFVLNEDLRIYLKHSTKGRSPWGFTFTVEEQSALEKHSASKAIIAGLVCGGDGVVTLPYAKFRTVAPPSGKVVYVSCFRRHGEHYEINGPAGKLPAKIAPSDWQRILATGFST
jgi:hypothetical protein